MGQFGPTQSQAGLWGRRASFTNTPIDMIEPKGSAFELLDQTNPVDPTGDSFSATWERAGEKLHL